MAKVKLKTSTCFGLVPLVHVTVSPVCVWIPLFIGAWSDSRRGGSRSRMGLVTYAADGIATFISVPHCAAGTPGEPLVTR